MILLAVTVVPTMACSPGKPCGPTGLDTTTNLQSGVLSDYDVTATMLSGQPMDNLLANIMENKDVKYFDKTLSSRDYQQQLSKAQIYKVFAKNSTNTIEAIIAEIPYNTNKKGVNASIMYISSDTQEYVQAIVDGTDAISKSMKILKDNQTFDEAVASLIIEGFAFDESDIMVKEVITKDADMSLVTIKATNATNQSRSIVAVVDNEKNKLKDITVTESSFECDICKAIVGLIVRYGIGFVMATGATGACGFFCLSSLALAGVGYIICFGICVVIVGSFMYLIVPGVSAAFVCDVAGYC
jgi:CBS domain-containing protein